MSKPRAKKNPKIGKFERSPPDNTPFAHGGPGIPGGWTPIADEPSNPKNEAPIKVIKIDNSVKEKDSYLANVKNMMSLGRKIAKESMPIIGPRMAKAEATLEKKTKKTSKKEEPKNDE